MDNEFNVSGKVLGMLGMKDSYCPRCFWVKVRLKNNLPYSTMPGIFSSFDAYQKNAVVGFYQKQGHLPSWLDGWMSIIKPVENPPRKVFTVRFDKKMLGIEQDIVIHLTGIPDLICATQDGGYAILDFKTARLTENQDFLHPLYTIQVNSYAYIAERAGLGPVKSLGLVYFDPITQGEGVLDRAIAPAGLDLTFCPKKKEIICQPDVLIPPLLKQAAEILVQGTAPAGDSRCQDCEKTTKMMQFLQK